MAFSGGGGPGGVGDVLPLLSSFAKGAALTIGGIVTLRAAITFVKLQGQYGLASINKNQAKLYSCSVCKAKGFYMCKLCKGNATIQWSPLYDPVVINPCLCPTCDGHRVQRCLNCSGSGYVRRPGVTTNLVDADR